MSVTSITSAPAADLTNLKAVTGALKQFKADQKTLNKDLRGVAQIHKQITEINKDYIILDKILCVVLAIIFPVIGTFFAVKKWKNIQAMQLPRQIGIAEMTVVYGKAAEAGLHAIQTKVADLNEKRQNLFPNAQKAELAAAKKEAADAKAALAAATKSWFSFA